MAHPMESPPEFVKVVVVEFPSASGTVVGVGMMICLKTVYGRAKVAGVRDGRFSGVMDLNLKCDCTFGLAVAVAESAALGSVSVWGLGEAIQNNMRLDIYCDCV